MNAIELYFNDGKPAHVFYCAHCRNVAHSHKLADQCCRNYICERCGKDTGTRSWLICDDCRKLQDLEKEADRFAKAEKIPAKDWKGWVFCDGMGFSNGYFPSVDDMLSDIDEDQTPEYAWACTEIHFVHVDLSDILEHIEGYEDFDPSDCDGLKELEEAIARFNYVNTDKVMYEPDYTKAVIL